MGDLLPRGFRFTFKDKNLLTKLVNRFPAISYRGLDAESLAKKIQAWEELTIQFNSSNRNEHGFNFNSRHLKALWKRMKMQWKKAAVAEESRKAFEVPFDSTNGSNEMPLPDTSDHHLLAFASDSIGTENNETLYICAEDPPSPFVLPDDPPTETVESDVCGMYPSCTVNMEIGDPIVTSTPETTCTPPPIQEYYTPYHDSRETAKKRKLLQIEIDNLKEEHSLRIECLKLDKEVKILKKWKLQQEILAAGFQLPPANYS